MRSLVAVLAVTALSTSADPEIASNATTAGSASSRPQVSIRRQLSSFDAGDFVWPKRFATRSPAARPELARASCAKHSGWAHDKQGAELNSFFLERANEQRGGITKCDWVCHGGDAFCVPHESTGRECC